MKTKTLILIWALMGSLSMMYGQSKSDINELLERLNQNYSGAITDVFSSEEIDQLNLHFSNQRTEEENLPTRSLTGEVFAPENVNENFGQFDTMSPEIFTKIGPSTSADFEGAGAYDPFIGLFYVIDNVGNSYAVDPVSGIYVSLGAVTAPPGESFTGLEFDPTNGTLYAISTTGTGTTSTLSTIDPVTGVVTVIGNTNLVLAIALTMNLLGTYLYAYDIDTDLMYRLNKLNAAATPLGPIGFDASFGQGMFLDPFTGLIFLTAFNNGTFQSELRTLDTATGATTLVGPIGSDSPGGTVQFAWAGQNKLTLGTTDNVFNSLKLYPNPSGDEFMVQASEPIDEIVLTTILGQEIQKIQANATNQTVDISALETGVYLVSVYINGARTTRRLIKQ